MDKDINLGQHQVMGVSSTVTDAIPIIGTSSTNDEVFEDVNEEGRKPLEIVVKKSKTYRGPPQPKVYRMSSEPRGSVLIINNEEFDNDVLSERIGSSVDVTNLTNLFKQLGFNVQVEHNLSRSAMMRTIRDFSSLPSHSTADMSVVCILSHGGSHGNVMTSDGQSLEVEWVLSQFNNQGCPGLHCKPKLFLLQACRGEKEEYGIVKESVQVDGDNTNMRSMGRTRTRTMPTWEDMLIAYAAVPGHVANRNHFRGSWFIECFCQVLMENAADLDLLEMLSEVAHKLKSYETEFGRKQSFSYDVRHFYNKLYFNPGINKPLDCLENTISIENDGTESIREEKNRVPKEDKRWDASSVSLVMSSVAVIIALVSLGLTVRGTKNT